MTTSASFQIQTWPIDKLVFYARNPRKNDAAVDRMCASIREFGFKIRVLARSTGEVFDGHPRLKAARKLGWWPLGDITAIPEILCDGMDAAAGEGIPAGGESLGQLGRLGRRTDFRGSRSPRCGF